MFRLLKKSKLIGAIVPQLKELNVENIWNLILEVEELKYAFQVWKNISCQAENTCIQYIKLWKRI